MLGGGVTLLGWELKSTLPKANGLWNPSWKGLVGKFLQGNRDPEMPFNLSKTVIPSWGSVLCRHPPFGTLCRDVEQTSPASDGKSIFRCHYWLQKIHFGFTTWVMPSMSRSQAAFWCPQFTLLAAAPWGSHFSPFHPQLSSQTPVKKHNTKLRNNKTETKCCVLCFGDINYIPNPEIRPALIQVFRSNTLLWRFNFIYRWLFQTRAMWRATSSVTRLIPVSSYWARITALELDKWPHLPSLQIDLGPPLLQLTRQLHYSSSEGVDAEEPPDLNSEVSCLVSCPITNLLWQGIRGKGCF